MATRKNKKERQEEESIARSKVDRITDQDTSLMNQLTLSLKINQAKREEVSLQQQIKDLGRKAVIDANKYTKVTQEIKQLEKELIDAKKSGHRQTIKFTQDALAEEKKKQASLQRTVGGQLRAMQEEAKQRHNALTTEKKLIQDINKERGIGGRIMDLFRTKEQKQKAIDLARARVGGGTNEPRKDGREGPTGGKGGGLAETLMSTGHPYAVIAGGIVKGLEKMMGPVKALGNLTKDALVSPFADAANLLTGENYGMGSGKVRATGAGSLIGGIQQFAASIPIVGGFLSGLAGILKTVVEGILGIEQGIFRFGRAINLSYGQASRMKSSFEGIAASSGHLAINADRMMHSQAEIGKQLGVNKQLSADILKNDVLLRDVMGVEESTRKTIAETSIISNKSAIQLTSNIINTVTYFNKLAKTGFFFNNIMQEANKLTGILGLQFAMFPEKMTKTLMLTKTLGMELQQLDGVANGLLDFENSITKEMEAQVLTGKSMNLTRAREAALNNDYATLAEEIAKNVGKAADFTKMKRIQQEALAASVGMTANGLADVLKKQEMYKSLGAEDLETFKKKMAILEKQGKTQAEISAMMGKDNYNAYVQMSTAERITEILEKMKRTFVELIRQSHIFDFLTSPEKITSFVRALADKLASVIDIIGRVVATMIEGVAYVVGIFSEDKADSMRSLATRIRGGAGTIAGSIRTATGVGTGEPAAPVGQSSQELARGQARGTVQVAGQSSGAAAPGSSQPMVIHNYMVVDSDILAQKNSQALPMFFGNGKR